MAYVPYPPTLPIETPGDSAADNKDGGIAPPDTREMTAPGGLTQAGAHQLKQNIHIKIIIYTLTYFTKQKLNNMKHNKRQIISGLKALAAVMAMMFTVTSCGMMEDDQSDCPKQLRVNFKYDMNMKFADAFPNEVKTVTLYAFDKDGNLALQKLESVKDIENRGGYMSVDELKPGNYTLKVWAEGEERFANSYIYGNTDNKNISTLTSRINRSTRAIDHDITALYHGLLKDADLNLDGYGVKTATVELTKNTNVVRVVMQNASGKKLNAADFDFYIKDDNSFLGYDNAAMPEDSITYVAWSKYDGILNPNHQPTVNSDESVTPTSAVVAEMTVNRLFADKNPQLCIFKHATGEKILQIPLIDYVLLVKGNYNKGMTDQEYLDRQDEYNFVFFIDDNHNWLAAQIYINSWRVVLNNTEF